MSDSLFGIDATAYEEWKKNATLAQPSLAKLEEVFEREREKLPEHLRGAFDELFPKLRQKRGS